MPVHRSKPFTGGPLGMYYQACELSENILHDIGDYFGVLWEFNQV